MDLRRLRHLVVLAEQRNFQRAAEQLKLSQPALTRSVQAAEREVGLRLFDRSNAGITPTPAGEFLLERARRIVLDNRSLMRDMQLLRERKLGNVAFGVGPFPAASLLPKLLADLRREHPDIQTRVVVGSWDWLSRHLLSEDIEFFIADTRDLPGDPDIECRPLGRMQAGAFVRPEHPLARKRKLTLADIWADGVASVRVPASIAQKLAPLLGARDGDAVHRVLECDDIDTLRQVALATDTVLVVPEAAVAAELAAGRLKPLKVEGIQHLYSEMGLVSQRGRSFSPMADLVSRRLSQAIMR